MAQSPEYADLLWVPPASWTAANRTSVQLIVIHTTEGSEGPTSAEDGAAYDQRRTDGTSTHFFHDQNSTVQCVRTDDIAHAARRQGNLRGIQHELCGRAGQDTTGWADTASMGTLRQAARQCARDARKWGIPVRHLTVAEVADGVKGFCGHVDVTYAFPLDNGTHSDPGPTFPWSQFLDMVQTELEILSMDEQSIAQAVASKLYADLSNPASGLFTTTIARVRDGVGTFWWDAHHSATQDQTYLAADATTQRRMRNAEDTVRSVTGGPVDEAGILAATQGGHLDVAGVVAGVLAGLGPSADPQQLAAAVVAALPAGQPDLVKQFADELAARLAA